MIEGDKDALVCQHHGHLEVSAEPPSPTSDGQKKGEGQKIWFSMQSVGVIALGVTPESQGKICIFDKSMYVYIMKLYLFILVSIY